jgi:hypothetical protein
MLHRSAVLVWDLGQKSLLIEVSKSKEYHAEPWFSKPVLANFTCGVHSL